MIALVGVVIGALATGGVTLGIGFVQTRRERSVARRLAAADVADALRAVKDTQTNLRAGREWPVGGDEWHEEDRTWPPGWERANWTQSWQSYRQTLASSIPEMQFAHVARAFGIMTQLQNSLAAGERPFRATDEAFINDVADRLSAAGRALPLAETMMSDPLLPPPATGTWLGLD
jgi:hypothetical protein